MRGAWRALGSLVCVLLRALTVVRSGRRGRRPELAFQASVGPPVRRSARSRRPQGSGIFARRRNNSCGSRWAPELLARKPRAAPPPLQKQGAEVGPRSLTAAFRCKPACEAIDSVVVMSRRRRMRNETYHGCQIAASLFCARQTKCSKLPVAGVRRRAWAVAGGLEGRLNRRIPKLS